MSNKKNNYNKKNNKKNNNKNVSSKKAEILAKNGIDEGSFRNPAKSKIGRIIIVFLALAMAFSGVITLIILACLGKL